MKYIEISAARGKSVPSSRWGWEVQLRQAKPFPLKSNGISIYVTPDMSNGTQIRQNNQKACVLTKRWQHLKDLILVVDWSLRCPSSSIGAFIPKAQLKWIQNYLKLLIRGWYIFTRAKIVQNVGSLESDSSHPFPISNNSMSLFCCRDNRIKHRHRRNVTSHHSFSLLWQF